MSLEDDIVKKIKDSNLGIGSACLLTLVVLVIALLLNGFLVYIAWNWLILEIVPALTTYTLTYLQCCAIGVVLSIIGGFFKGK